MHERYIRRKSIWCLRQEHPHWLWRNLLKHRDYIKEKIGVKVGDGSKVKFWSDPWLQGGGLSLSDVFPNKLRSLTGLHIDTYLSGVLKDGMWLIPRSHASSKLLEFLNDKVPFMTGGADEYIIDGHMKIGLKLAWSITCNSDVAEPSWGKWLWKNKAPKAQVIHMWRCLRNRAATLDNLKKRVFQLASRCENCCEDEENISHISF